MTPRVVVTATAAKLLGELADRHGPVMFHQSGGCCDGSAPMCYPLGEFKIGQRDVYLGRIAGCPLYISGPQFEYWQHTHLIIDVVPGRGQVLVTEPVAGLSLRGTFHKDGGDLYFREVSLVPLRGTRTIWGFQGMVMGKLD